MTPYRNGFSRPVGVPTRPTGRPNWSNMAVMWAGDKAMASAVRETHANHLRISAFPHFGGFAATGWRTTLGTAAHNTVQCR